MQIIIRSKVYGVRPIQYAVPSRRALPASCLAELYLSRCSLFRVKVIAFTHRLRTQKTTASLGGEGGGGEPHYGSHFAPEPRTAGRTPAVLSLSLAAADAMTSPSSFFDAKPHSRCHPHSRCSPFSRPWSGVRQKRADP